MKKKNIKEAFTVKLMTSTDAQNGYLNRLCVFYDHSWEQVALN